MAQAAFGGLDLVEVSDREIRREGPSYTIDTVRELLEEAATTSISSSAPTWPSISTRWHEADDPAHAGSRGRRAATRARSTVVPDGWDGYEIEMDPVDLSSTFIRELALAPKSCGNIVPRAVFRSTESFPRLKFEAMAVRHLRR